MIVGPTRRKTAVRESHATGGRRNRGRTTPQSSRVAGNVCHPPDAALRVKRIGFLSFGHWAPGRGSLVATAADALQQTLELSVAAEEVGADGAFVRVHHFARQLASPFPLLAAIGARTSRIEIGTAVIDMRYENPLYMAEDAGAADLIAGGRLQLGISRGSPEQVIDGYRHFGHVPTEGESDADMARRHAEVFLGLLEGEGFEERRAARVARGDGGEAVEVGLALVGVLGVDAVEERAVVGEERVDLLGQRDVVAAEGEYFTNPSRFLEGTPERLLEPWTLVEEATPPALETVDATLPTAERVRLALKAGS